MSRLRPAFLLYLLFLTLPMLGAPIQLHVAVAGPPAPASPPPIEIHIIGGPSGQQQKEDLLRAENGTAHLDLPSPGVWYVTPRAAGYFGETRALVTPHEGGHLDLQLWPAATLRGELPPRSVVKSVTVRFQPVVADGHDTKPGPAVPAGATDCTIQGRRVECVIPAGRLDYSLRSFGHVPHYRWNQTHAPGDLVNLGRLDFRKGSSLIGRVSAPSRPRLPRNARVRVTLTPDVPDMRPDSESRSRITAATVLADERGTFVFEGVTPGAYHLSATAPGVLSERREVTVLEGLEAELREPLVLAPPLILSVRIDPPTDPWGGPWTLELVRMDLRAGHGSVVESSSPNTEGRWKRSDLQPGDYELKVRRAQGVWHSEMLTLQETTAAEITIPLVRVVGKLRLGETPIAGSIWFGGEFGEISVPVTTNPEGIFRAILPGVENNVWKEVLVVAERPPVRASLTDIRLDGPDARGIARVEIVLPSNRLYGEVTTDDGKPISSAMVYADPAGEGVLLQIEADQAGTFTFNGIAAGTYSVRAMGVDGKSEAMNVVIEEGSDKYMRIVLEKDATIAGTVTSRHGPVAGARVSIFPEDRMGFGLLPRDRTDFDGRFSVAVSPRSRNMSVTVEAPGFAYKLFDLPAEPEQPLAIRVEQNGGRLVIEADQPEALQRFLFHGSAFLPVGGLLHGGVATMNGERLIVDNLEPGHYDLCVATELEAPILARSARVSRQCAGGFLAPGGSLTLEAH